MLTTNIKVKKNLFFFIPNPTIHLFFTSLTIYYKKGYGTMEREI